MPKQTFYNLPEEKRQRITDIVIDEFADNDYANVSISRIVARAGIAKGSFYQYFEDKEDLTSYLLEIIANLKAETLSLDHPDPEHVGIFKYLKWLLENSAKFELAHPRLSRAGYRMTNGGTDENKIFAQAMKSAEHYYSTLVALGKQQGDIAPELDDEMAATVFRVILSEMGRHIIQRIVAQYGTDWQGETAIFEFPEAQAMYAQLLQMLEFGLGNHVTD